MAPPEMDGGAIETAAEQLRNVATDLEGFADCLRPVIGITTSIGADKFILSVLKKDIRSSSQKVLECVTSVIALHTEDLRLIQSHGQALQEANCALDQKTAEVSRLTDKQSELDGEITRLNASHADQLAALKAEHTSEIEKLTESLGAKRTEIGLLNVNFENNVAQLRSDHQAQVKTLEEERSQRDTIINDLKTSQRTDVEKLIQSHTTRVELLESEIARLNSAHAVVTRDLEKSHVDRMEEAEEHWDRKRSEIQQGHNAACEELRLKYFEQIDGLQRKNTELQQSHDLALDDLRLKHTQATERDRSQLRDSHEAALKKLSDEHAQTLQDNASAVDGQISQLQMSHQAAVELLRQEHANALEDIKADHDREITRLNAVLDTATGAVDVLKQEHASQVVAKDREILDLRQLLDAKKRELEAISGEHSQANARLVETTGWLTQAQSVVAELRETVDQLRESILRKEAQIGVLDGELADAQDQLVARRQDSDARELALREKLVEEQQLVARICREQRDSDHRNQEDFRDMKNSYNDCVQSIEAEMELERLQGEEELESLRRELQITRRGLDNQRALVEDRRREFEKALAAGEEQKEIDRAQREEELKAELEERAADEAFHVYRVRIDFLEQEVQSLKTEQQAKVDEARLEVATEDTVVLDELVESHQAEVDQYETEKSELVAETERLEVEKRELQSNFAGRLDAEKRKIQSQFDKQVSALLAQRQKEIDEAVRVALCAQTNRITKLQLQVDDRDTTIAILEERRQQRDAARDSVEDAQPDAHVAKDMPEGIEQSVGDRHERSLSDINFDPYIFDDAVESTAQQVADGEDRLPGVGDPSETDTTPGPAGDQPTPTVPSVPSAPDTAQAPAVPSGSATSPTPALMNTRSKRKSADPQAQEGQKRSRKKVPGAEAHANGQALLSKFCIAWNATAEERRMIDATFRIFFSLGKDPAAVEGKIDQYCMGTFTRRPVYPPTCFHAAILGHNSGSGGSNHAQVNCKECNKLGTVCMWAKFHPDVHTGYGDRDENGVVPSGEARAYKPDAEPRTIHVEGRDIRWILKRRKETPVAPDETDWDLGGKVV